MIILTVRMLILIGQDDGASFWLRLKAHGSWLGWAQSRPRPKERVGEYEFRAVRRPWARAQTHLPQSWMQYSVMNLMFSFVNSVFC